MNVITVIALFVVTLLLVVFVHELGHFIAAKRIGVKVEEFGLGFPPRLLAIRRGETVYSLNAIPVGAFVRSVAEDDPAVPGSLASKGSWARLVVYAAGPVANILLAFVLLSAFFTLPEDVIVGNGVMVYQVAENSPAEEAGIGSGDLILEADGEPIRKWGDIQGRISSRKEGEEITLALQTNEIRREVSLVPEFDADLGRRAIGVTLCRNLVSEIEIGSAVDEAGIKPGDTILSVNGQIVYSEEVMSDVLASVGMGEEISFTAFRQREKVIANIIKEPTSALGVMGMELLWVDVAHIEQVRLPLIRASHLAGSFIIDMPSMIVASVPLIREDPGKALVGPIGAGQLTVEAVRSFGPSNVVYMAGIISLGIALFNFLPVPPLDGAGILVALVERTRRGKRLSPRMLHLAYTIGTTFLISLMVLVTYSDLLRIITGGSFGL